MSDIVISNQNNAQLNPAQSSGMVHQETSIASAAAGAQAAVQARYVMALNRPRNIDSVRLEMIKEGKRPSFAKVAIYQKPLGGKKIIGPSIRFAEMAIRVMKNILVETPAIFDDTSKRVVRVTVTDLETNSTYSRDVTIQKTVERKRLKDGQKPFSQRVNSYGEMTYTVQATDDDVLNKENALISKAIRTCALRLIPGDIIDETLEEVGKTLRSRAGEDPDKERRSICDSFFQYNISPEHLTAFLGCDIGVATPSQLVELRSMFVALRDGEITTADIIDHAGTGSNKKEGKKQGKLEAVLNKQKKNIAMKKDSQKQKEGTEKQKTSAHQEQPVNDEIIGDQRKLTEDGLAEIKKDNSAKTPTWNPKR